jgi:hypothetical protein
MGFLVFFQKIFLGIRKFLGDFLRMVRLGQEKNIPEAGIFSGRAINIYGFDLGSENF